MYAHDFSRWGDVVTQCIETHIRRVSDSLFVIHVLFSQECTYSSDWFDGVAILSRNSVVTRHVFVSVVALHYKGSECRKKLL